MNGIATSAATPLTAEELHRINAWWRAANYLNIGQIYLSANPLLREKLTVDHIKPRLLGHWGTSPGLNLIYVHLNRLIKKYDLNTIYMAGPGHGGPALLANVFLEGSYTEFYPEITNDEAGCGGFSGSSRRPAACRATSACRRPDRSMKGASSVMCWCTPSAR
jgi:xylulose-5-phosphate/fructose-6-phosphate phosphoketolase